ncbi:hypothetical protein [Cohnella sp. JJ-181]|uniref:hypothetical protein n=1 Tax=Cohnella rhizoplanae TaxID=2974897 RepID=UPI0022FF9FC5|nr:hypothetical protein [Cohnella sp. JJ-181]CAI6085264.1 hypothetical protein COHCIP112018_04615 [Cohnella sp. JJ-181]
MKNTRASATLLVSQFIFVLLVIPWLIVALMSFMIFDSPDSVETAWPIAVVVFVWAYPLGLIVSIALSWVLYHKRKFRGAVWCNFIPLIWLLPAVYVTFFLDSF